MRIVDIRLKTVSLRSPMRNADMAYDEMTGSLAAIRFDMGGGRTVWGLGYDTIGRYGSGLLAEARFAPRLKAASADSLLDAEGRIDPFRARAVMMKNEKPGGHGDRAGSVGLLDMALWDGLAKAMGVPLWRLLADRYNGGQATRKVWSYGSGGHYYPGAGTEALVAELRRYHDLGFRTLKMKVAGAPLAEDLQRVEAALKVVGEGANLAVDACAAPDAATAHRLMTALAPYRLAWIEEPVAPLDFPGLAEVAAAHAMPIGTGENILSLDDLKNLIRYGGLRADRDWLQVDPPIAYGLTEYLDAIAWLEANGWSRRRLLPHAGHIFSLNLAVGLGIGGYEAAPDPKPIFGGFADGTRIEDGCVIAPEHIGIGFEHKPNLWAVFADMVV